MGACSNVVEPGVEGSTLTTTAGSINTTISTASDKQNKSLIPTGTYLSPKQQTGRQTTQPAPDIPSSELAAPIPQSIIKEPQNKTRYSLFATLDYTEHHLVVEQRIDYINKTGIDLKTIPLVVEPRRYPGAFKLNRLTWEDDSKGQYQWKETGLVLIPESPLAPGDLLSLSLSYELYLPPTDKYTRTQPRPFGYTDRQANLGDWYPFVPPYDPVRSWLVHDAGSFGEHLVYDISDYEVQIELTGTEQDLVIAASALGQLSEEKIHYQHPNARSFAWSASPFYQAESKIVEQPGGEPITVMSYYFPFYEKAGRKVLEASGRALTLYAELFGPLSHNSLTVVLADFIDGMEYDGLYFLSKDYYNWYTGSEAEFLVAIAAHETAHQWWYGLVGNDQATEPWLDEALCTYSERLYFERTHPEGLDWWWTYRVDYFEPKGAIDISIYDVTGDFTNYNAYRDVVYLNGAKFLEDLRGAIGDEAFFATLRTYLARNTYTVATGPSFLSILPEYSSSDLTQILDTYLGITAP